MNVLILEPEEARSRYSQFLDMGNKMAEWEISFCERLTADSNPTLALPTSHPPAADLVFSNFANPYAIPNGASIVTRPTLRAVAARIAHRHRRTLPYTNPQDNYSLAELYNSECEANSVKRTLGFATQNYSYPDDSM